MLVSVVNLLIRNTFVNLIAIVIVAFIAPRCWSMTSDNSVMQVLVYKGEALINQGSAIVVAPEVLVTSTHLLEKATSIVVLDHDNNRYSATERPTGHPQGLALLDAAVPVQPIVLAESELTVADTVNVVGYWHDTQEKAKKSLFPISGRPKFVATVVPQRTATKGLLKSAHTEVQNASVIEIVSSVGRGSYGGALINRCQQLSGVMTPAPELTLRDLWKPHKPLGVYAVKSQHLHQILLDAGVTQARRAASVCLSLQQQQQQQAKAKERRLQANLQKEKQQAKKAQAAQLKAQAEAASEREQREREQQKNSDLAHIAADADNQLKQLSDQMSTAEESNQQMLWLIVISAGVALVIIGWIIYRNKTQLAVATAYFYDCQFTGKDSRGAPLALMVLGRDLQQRQTGLLLGRNPDQVHIVIADDTVSRVHARLSIANRCLYIEDTGSTSGVRINGDIASEKTAIITGDIITLGNVQLTLTIMKEP